MANVERLYAYYPFSEETMGAVEDAATTQNDLSFRELADRYNLDDASIRTNVDGKPIEYLHLVDRDPGNDDTALLFGPFGNSPLAPHIVVRALRQFASDRPREMFVFGGPAAIDNHNNLLTRQERRLVHSGDFSPTVAPILKEMGRLRVKSTDVYGYSLGATLGQQH